MSIDINIQESYKTEISEREEEKAGNTISDSLVCMYQMFRPNYIFNKEGIGNCHICTSDENNKKCKKYYPIRMFRINVLEE